MMQVWFLFKSLEAFVGAICVTFHCLGFQRKEPLPHILLYCGTFFGFTIMSLTGVIALAVGAAPPALTECIINFVAAFLYIVASIMSMHHAETDFHLMYLSDFEEPKHPYFSYCRAQSICALAAGALHLMHAVLAFDVMLIPRHGTGGDSSDESDSETGSDVTTLERRPIRMYFLSKVIESKLRRFPWFDRLCRRRNPNVSIFTFSRNRGKSASQKIHSSKYSIGGDSVKIPASKSFMKRDSKAKEPKSESKAKPLAPAPTYADDSPDSEEESVSRVTYSDYAHTLLSAKDEKPLKDKSSLSPSDDNQTRVSFTGSAEQKNLALLDETPKPPIPSNQESTKKLSTPFRLSEKLSVSRPSKTPSETSTAPRSILKTASLSSEAASEILGTPQADRSAHAAKSPSELAISPQQQLSITPPASAEITPKSSKIRSPDHLTPVSSIAPKMSSLEQIPEQPESKPITPNLSQTQPSAILTPAPSIPPMAMSPSKASAEQQLSKSITPKSSGHLSPTPSIPAAMSPSKLTTEQPTPKPSSSQMSPPEYPSTPAPSIPAAITPSPHHTPVASISSIPSNYQMSKPIAKASSQFQWSDAPTVHLTPTPSISPKMSASTPTAEQPLKSQPTPSGGSLQLPPSETSIGQPTPIPSTLPPPPYTPLFADSSLTKPNKRNIATSIPSLPFSEYSESEETLRDPVSTQQIEMGTSVPSLPFSDKDNDPIESGTKTHYFTPAASTGSIFDGDADEDEADPKDKVKKPPPPPPPPPPKS